MAIVSSPFEHGRRLRWLTGVFVGLVGLFASGCASPSVTEGGARVIFLDGAGWSGSHQRVRAGMRAAGYRGRVEDYPWSSLLGPGPDHFLVARKKAKGRQLAERIEKIRAEHPDDPIHLMGLSAGTAVVVFALEQLPPGMYVDHVVLFSPSMSDQTSIDTIVTTIEDEQDIQHTLAELADARPTPIVRILETDLAWEE